MTIMDKLISDIHSYCAAANISPATFGAYAVNDSKFVARIEAGGQCLPKTVDKVRHYMAANPAKKTKGAAA